MDSKKIISKYTARDYINIALKKIMKENPHVFIIGEEIGASDGPFKVTKGLQKMFGAHRVIDTPISEIGFTGLAAGAAMAGLCPIVEYMNWGFALQALDHIVNTCSKISYMSGGRHHCPIIFRGPSGYNPGYAAQHTQEFYSLYGAIPKLVVIAPYSAEEHGEVIEQAYKLRRPVVILENEVLYNKESKVLPNTEYLHNIENNEQICTTNTDNKKLKAKILQSGTDLTIVGVSLALSYIEEAAKQSKYSIEIINLLYIQPIDKNTIIESVSQTKRLLIVDFSPPHFGLASEISSIVYNELYGLINKIEVLTGADTPVPYSEYLEKEYYPGVSKIVNKIEEMMKSDQSKRNIKN